MFCSPIVSVISPVFNAEGYVAQSIQSVIDQSYSEWELIIINDGSTDGSKETILSFSDKRIKYFEQKNKGVSAARNVGLDNMRSDFFCFLDSDDFLPPNSLESRVNLFRRNPKLNFVDGGVLKMDSELKEVRSKWQSQFEGNPLSELVKLSGRCFFGPSWMIKRDKKKKYRFREEIAHGEDLIFYMDLARQGGDYGYTEETVLHYRDHPLSAMKNLQGLEEGYRAIYKVIKEWPEIGYSDLHEYKRKTRQIMFRSYLRHGQLKRALHVLRSWMD